MRQSSRSAVFGDPRDDCAVVLPRPRILRKPDLDCLDDSASSPGEGEVRYWTTEVVVAGVGTWLADSGEAVGAAAAGYIAPFGILILQTRRLPTRPDSY